MLFALLDAATAVQSICLLGGQGNAGTRPERRCKSGMDGGLTAASSLSSPPLYLRTAVFLSNQPGPPHSATTFSKTRVTMTFNHSSSILATADTQLSFPLMRRTKFTFVKTSY